MNKIIEIKRDVVLIGLDNGSIREIKSNELNFVPHIGDEVEIFETETRVIVSKVEKKLEGININMVQQSQQVQEVIPVGVYVTSKKVVNKWIYVLLALFLGWLGVHKFYEGKTGTGMRYLYFFWTMIPLFLSLFEGVSALFKNADEDGNIIV